jgi:uncharacterized protein (TIGR02421 family)
MANYEPLQEGLAVLAEYLVGGLDQNRLRLLAGRVLAIHYLTSGADFVETFRELNQCWGFYRYPAFNITMRVYRGGGYTKDAVYLGGLVQVLGYLASGGDIEPLYLGKIALEHLSFIEELRWRKILKPVTMRPLFLDHPDAKERLGRLRKGCALLDLIKEEGVA